MFEQLQNYLGVQQLQVCLIIWQDLVLLIPNLCRPHVTQVSVFCITEFEKRWLTTCKISSNFVKF